jgi:DNA repair photolyase
MGKIIYEPRGKAKEYAPLAANLYRGCSHACTYCYAPAATFCSRERFSGPGYVQPRRDVLTALEKDARQLAGDPREILMSFTTDPYQRAEKRLKLTRMALKILMSNYLTVTILTKGGVWGLERDMDLLTRNWHNTWSVTLTHDDSAVSRAWEPGAALPEDRIESLRIAHSAGLKTWISFEPVIDPEAVYRLLEATAPFVDFYKVGKLNYHPRAREINWPEFCERVESQLKRLGKPYYLKQDLLEAAGRKDESDLSGT